MTISSQKQSSGFDTYKQTLELHPLHIRSSPCDASPHPTDDDDVPLLHYETVLIACALLPSPYYTPSHILHQPI